MLPYYLLQILCGTQRPLRLSVKIFEQPSSNSSLFYLCVTCHYPQIHVTLKERSLFCSRVRVVNLASTSPRTNTKRDHCLRDF